MTSLGATTVLLPLHACISYLKAVWSRSEARGTAIPLNPNAGKRLAPLLAELAKTEHFHRNKIPITQLQVTACFIAGQDTNGELTGHLPSSYKCVLSHRREGIAPHQNAPLLPSYDQRSQGSFSNCMWLWRDLKKEAPCCL